MKTVKTHNNVNLGGYGVQSSGWMESGNYKRLALTQLQDVARSANTHVHWSHDATALHGMDSSVMTGSSQWKAGIVDIKAKYFRIQATNADATNPVVVSAWVTYIP